MRDSKSRVLKESSVTGGLKVKEMTASKQIQFFIFKEGT